MFKFEELLQKENFTAMLFNAVPLAVLGFSFHLARLFYFVVSIAVKVNL